MTMIDSITAPYGALVLRVCLGIMFFAHAMLKIRVYKLPGTVAYFKSLGLPGWLAYGPIAPSEGRGRGPLGVRFDSVRRRDKP